MWFSSALRSKYAVAAVVVIALAGTYGLAALAMAPQSAAAPKQPTITLSTQTFSTQTVQTNGTATVLQTIPVTVTAQSQIQVTGMYSVHVYDPSCGCTALFGSTVASLSCSLTLGSVTLATVNRAYYAAGGTSSTGPTVTEAMTGSQSVSAGTYNLTLTCTGVADPTYPNALIDVGSQGTSLTVVD